MINKRGQFFILVAVILSAIIINLSVTRNYAIVSKEPEEFYDLTYQINEESARVIDYGVYTGEEKLLDFIEKAQQEISDQDPQVDLIVVHGNKTHTFIDEFKNVNSDVTLKVGDIKYTLSVTSGYPSKKIANIPFQKLKESEGIAITINNKDYTFSPKTYERYYMIIKKDSGKEQHVSIGRART